MSGDSQPSSFHATPRAVVSSHMRTLRTRPIEISASVTHSTLGARTSVFARSEAVHGSIKMQANPISPRKRQLLKRMTSAMRISTQPTAKESGQSALRNKPVFLITSASKHEIHPSVDDGGGAPPAVAGSAKPR